jgi:hypothetical protein
MQQFRVDLLDCWGYLHKDKKTVRIIISLLYDVYMSLFAGLTLDIIVPAGTKASSKLPVLFVSLQLL